MVNLVGSELSLDVSSATCLDGLCVAIAGRLCSFSKREAQALIRQHGGVCVDWTDPRAQLIVVGGDQLPFDVEPELCDVLVDRAAQGALEVIGESAFGERLGVVGSSTPIRQLYTPVMLAELLKVPPATIRRWHRQGLLKSVHEVHRLPYFDFQEVLSARRIAQLLAAGISANEIERKLRQLAKLFPDVERPLAQLAVIVEGRSILLRDDEGLIDSQGQRRFDFVDEECADRPATGENSMATTLSLEDYAVGQHQASVDELLRQAAELEAAGIFDAALLTYRSASLVDHSRADVHFLLAELLYRQGDITAARERYFVALELDEDYVEARANLGCVLAESGQLQLAIAAFEGALTRHPEYADVLFHLARTLDDIGRHHEALNYWRQFLAVAPDSPWATEARDRLGLHEFEAQRMSHTDGNRPVEDRNEILP